MDKVVLEKVNVRSFTHSTKLKAAQKKLMNILRKMI